MGCEFGPKLSDYMDGELSAQELQKIEGHLAVCSECRAVLNEMTQSAVLVREAFQRLQAPMKTEVKFLQSVRYLHQNAQERRILTTYYVCVFVTFWVIVGMLISPVGAFLSLVIRFMYVVFSGSVLLTHSFGHLWVWIFSATSGGLVLMSLFGFYRILRTSPNEVTV
jgi:predicted anti-sigma-YlaC factor YlaD